MTKDAKDNKRGCFIIAALVAVMIAALAYGILQHRRGSALQRHQPERSPARPRDRLGGRRLGTELRQIRKFRRRRPFPLAPDVGLRHGSREVSGSGVMRHYRVNKLAKPGGAVVKRKDILANDDRQAVARVAGRRRLPDLRRLARRPEDRFDHLKRDWPARRPAMAISPEEAGVARGPGIGAADRHPDSVAQAQNRTITLALRADHGPTRHPPAAMDLRTLERGHVAEGVAETAKDQLLAPVVNTRR